MGTGKLKLLDNLTIVDASTVLAGPSVGTFFAELGATVIKVEHPIHKDVTRTWKLPSENAASEISAYFSSINYLKKYVQLDLTNSSDRNSFFDLIENADILITNFKKGDDVKFGIEDHVLRKENSSLIIGKISGFGQESDRVAYDLILQAESGFMSINGTPKSGPIKMPVALIDVLSAHHLKEGLLLALYERIQNGKGRTVTVSLYDAAISSLVNQASNYLMTGNIPQRLGSKHPNIAPYGELFVTEDDAILTFAIGSNGHFNKLCKILGLRELINDQRFESNQARVNNRENLADIIASKVQHLNSNSILSELHDNNVPAAKVKDLAEVFESSEAKKLIREEHIQDLLTKRVTSIAFNYDSDSNS